MQLLRAHFELIKSLFPVLIRSFLSKYSIVKGVFYLLNNALISWVASRLFDVSWSDVFLLFVLGFPLLSFLNRLKSVPPCLLATYVMNKSLVRDAKKELKNLPLKTAEEWSDFQDFYEDDLAIGQYIASNPKAFIVYVRTRIQYQNFISALMFSPVICRAIDDLVWDAENKENVAEVENERQSECFP